MNIDNLHIETDKVFEIFRRHFGETELTSQFIMECFDNSGIPKYHMPKEEEANETKTD